MGMRRLAALLEKRGLGFLKQQMNHVSKNVSKKLQANPELLYFSTKMKGALGSVASKIFFAGLMWQLFAELAQRMSVSVEDKRFPLGTGAFEAAGVYGGHRMFSKLLGWSQANIMALLLASGAALSGGVWQLAANKAEKENFTPIETAFFVGFICTLAFAGGAVATKIAFDLLKKQTLSFAQVLEVSVCVGGAGAAFTTLKAEPDRPLGNSFWAGVSTSVGFAGAAAILGGAPPVAKIARTMMGKFH